MKNIVGGIQLHILLIQTLGPYLFIHWIFSLHELFTNGVVNGYKVLVCNFEVITYEEVEYIEVVWVWVIGEVFVLKIVDNVDVIVDVEVEVVANVVVDVGVDVIAEAVLDVFMDVVVDVIVVE